MSIRFRLIAICLVVALLPAIPLSILVRDLLEKSFNVGLSETVSGALESGMSVSRKHMERLHSDFAEDVFRVVSFFPRSVPDSFDVAVALSDITVCFDGFIVVQSGARRVGDDGSSSVLPRSLGEFSSHPVFMELVNNEKIIGRPLPAGGRMGLYLFETEKKTVQLALWSPPGDGEDNLLLLFRKTDPEFLSDAGRLLSGRQTFAQLRLVQEKLSRSFFYPFIIIYGVILVLSICLAFMMAERLASPVRRLVKATAAVADGDWRFQLEQRAGGEIGRLVSGFNQMIRHLDRQRRRLTDMEKMAAWREMARHLAHEIKNPLLPIRLTVQEMKDQYDGGDGRYEELLQESVRVVEDELEHLRKLVKEFSSFAKMPGLSTRICALDGLAADVSKLYPQAETIVEAGPDVREFSFDADQMRRVLVNLFDNSLCAMQGGEKAVIRIGITRRGDDAVLVFSDNGPGIPDENITKIFDPYFSTRRDGTGLGLALVKSIILQHGGTIDARSPSKGGAEFTITLPLAGPVSTDGAGEESGTFSPDRAGEESGTVSTDGAGEESGTFSPDGAGEESRTLKTRDEEGKVKGNNSNGEAAT